MNNNENNTSVTPEVGVNQTPVMTNTNVGMEPVNPEVVQQNQAVSLDTSSQPVSPEMVQNTVDNTPVVQPQVNVVTPTVQPQVNNISNGTGGDTYVAGGEKLKKVQNEYKPPSKGKTVLLIIFFILLIGFVIFLPDISSMINLYKAGNYNQATEKITTGKLTCTLESNTTNLDNNYKWVFNFSDNKLNKLSYTLETKGDVTKDEDTLNELSSKCDLLKDETDSLTGIVVSCDYSEGKLVEKQIFEYSAIDTEKINAAFTEAGGMLPSYEDGQDMDEIEKDMNAAGASCKREN